MVRNVESVCENNGITRLCFDSKKIDSERRYNDDEHVERDVGRECNCVFINTLCRLKGICSQLA